MNYKIKNYLEKNRRYFMKFTEITEKEYTKFWENHPNKSFL